MLQAPSWEDKHGQSAVLQMAAEGLETAQATGWRWDDLGANTDCLPVIQYDPLLSIKYQ